MNRLKALELQIANLPKGSVTKKVIQGKDRYYLQWREGEKVKSRYIKGAELPELSRQIELRKSLQQELQNLQVSSVYASSKTNMSVVADSGACYSAFNKNAVVERVVKFFLGLEHGFCLEGVQKRCSDIVFYNRLLHCGVVVLLKDDVFKKKYLEELDACVSYYGGCESHPLDSFPIGILLCFRKCERMVEFSTAGKVSCMEPAYKAILPVSELLKNFLEEVR